MDFVTLAWAFAATLTLHNLEEAIWLPAWSQAGGRWRVPIDATEFRFAVAVLTALAYACAWLATMDVTAGAYLLCGYALAMLLNAFIPHLIVTVMLREYAPGTASALLANVPISTLLVARAVSEGRISLSIFAWAAPLAVIALMPSIFLLFWIGRVLRRARFVRSG